MRETSRLQNYLENSDNTLANLKTSVWRNKQPTGLTQMLANDEYTKLDDVVLRLSGTFRDVNSPRASFNDTVSKTCPVPGTIVTENFDNSRKFQHFLSTFLTRNDQFWN